MDTDTDSQVKAILDEIESEKKNPKPDQKKMRNLFYKIVKLKDDYREVRTGQDDRFLTHTSTREFEDRDFDRKS